MLRFIAMPMAALCALLLASLPAYSAITLKNSAWSVTIAPETLGLAVQPAGKPSVDISTGVSPHSIDDLKAASDQASWLWDGAYTISAHLSGCFSLSMFAPAAIAFGTISSTARRPI